MPHYLSDDELKRVWAAAESLDPMARAFARLTLLTACRSSEITGLSWSEIQTEVNIFCEVGFDT